MNKSKLELFINSKILLNHFKELCRDFSPPYKEASLSINRKRAETNSHFVYFLSQIKRLIDEEKIDAETFRNEIKKITDVGIIHIEVLWYLEVADVLEMLEYIRYQEINHNTEVLEYVGQKVFESIIEDQTNSSQIRRQMLIDYIRVIFECSKNSNDTETSFYRIVLKLIASNLQQYYSSDSGSDIERYVEVQHLMDLCDKAKINCDVLKIFIQQVLSKLFMSSVESLKSVFKNQEKTENNVKDKKIYSFFTIMSKYCDLDFFITELQSNLLEASKERNWNHLLCFVTFLGSTYKNGWSSLKLLTDTILKKSFQALDVKLLSYAFLIARQGCFEKSNPSFPGYLQWFRSSFSSETKRLLTSSKICNFFFDFLTELLPYDSLYYLKVHINRVPWVPSDCSAILNNYVSLAKTYLTDLNVSVEIGICENLTNKSAATHDVETILKHFERTNEILSSVFQAAMFCKDYYEKKFLVELLSKFEGKKSTRHKFILKLHSCSKIPNSMFKAYKALEKKK